MNKLEKIRQIRKITGVKTHLSWEKLCSLTDFDRFSTALAFGINWKENCPNDRLVQMPESYINMILFNITAFPKERNNDR